MIKKGTQNFIHQIPGKASVQEMQKIVLTNTAHILRKVLSVEVNTLLSLIIQLPATIFPQGSETCDALSA